MIWTSRQTYFEVAAASELRVAMGSTITAPYEVSVVIFGVDLD